MGSGCWCILWIFLITAFLLSAECTTPTGQCAGRSARWEDLGGDFCYIVEVANTTTWIDAVYQCFLEGGSLASFHSQSETQRIVQRVNHLREGLHIGLWKLYDGSLAWVDKSSFDFRNWDRGEPNYDHEKCVVMHTDSGKWNDVLCTMEQGYVCSSPKITLDQQSERRRLSCPFSSSLWTDLGGDMCYIIELQLKQTWSQASLSCSALGGSLAIFHNVGEVSAVLRLTNQAPGGGLHIGLEQTERGNYKWIDESPVDLNLWESGEPYESENRCAEMNSHTAQWSSSPCDKISGYICSIRKAVCGGDIRSDEGHIYSPNFRNSYRKNEDCTWKIRVPQGYHVALQFQHFELEESTQCQKDFVKIIDGHRETYSNLLWTFCGVSGQNRLIYSSRSKVAIRFVSDDSTEKYGFSVFFTKVPICGGVLSAENGTIQSPNYPYYYPKATRCVWNIEVEDGYRVSLTFRSFKVDSSANACPDFVEIFDGSGTSSPTLAKLCGEDVPDGIISSGNKMTVVFSSDFFAENSGFMAEFRKDRCGGYIFAQNGRISSPNYPNRYRMHESCTWIITVPKNHTVALQFQDFQLQTESGCQHDYVDIKDGAASNSSLVARLCSVYPYYIYRSTTNTMTVEFQSNLSVQGKGFTAKFRKVRPCGEEITAERGIIRSPNYPNILEAGVKCVWKIIVPEGQKISITVPELHLKQNHNACLGNYLMIMDGAYSDRYHGLKRTACRSFANSVLSIGNTVDITLQTDLDKSEENTGFTLEFETYSCGGDYVAESGTVTSPNFPSNYRAYENCTWKITVPEGNAVLLQFLNFTVEDHQFCQFDFLSVYDGHETSSRLLGEFCGETLPDAVMSTTNKIALTFVSDGSHQRSGFAATFETTLTPFDRLQYRINEFPRIAIANHLDRVKTRIIMQNGKS